MVFEASLFLSTSIPESLVNEIFSSLLTILPVMRLWLGVF